MQDLGKRRFPEIARRIGISVEQVQKCANNIAQLDARPGAIFAQAPQNYVLPDVTVEKINGNYQVILNGEEIPHLRIINTYKDIMAQYRKGSESMSNTSVKEAILDLVKSEECNAPLSDKEIVEILSKRGIPIARRTVAKYRTELNILPSNMRRRY